MVTVFDGTGRSAQARVLSTSRDSVSLKLVESVRKTAIRPAITLAQAIPKQKNMEWIVQKAVELGVAEIQPLVTAHTIVHPRESKADKWRRNALEACKQCGQDTLPIIHDPMPFDTWLATRGQESEASLNIIASLAPGALPMRTILQSHEPPATATLLIGPEGDFTAEETAAACSAGFHPASLGSMVLRVETAALYCLAVLRCHYDSP